MTRNGTGGRPTSQKERTLRSLSFSLSFFFSSGHFNLCPWINQLSNIFTAHLQSPRVFLCTCLIYTLYRRLYSKVDVTQTQILPLHHTPAKRGPLFSSRLLSLISDLLLLSHLYFDKLFSLSSSFAIPHCDPCDPCYFRDIPTPLSLRHANTTPRLCHLLVPYMHLDKTFGISVTRDRPQFISNHHSNQSPSSCSAHQIGKKAPFYI